MRGILVQSDLVLVLLNLLSSIKYIYIKHLQTLVYIYQNIINSMQIYNTVNISIKQILRHFCDYWIIIFFILINIY